MKSKKRLIEDGLINDSLVISRCTIVEFYRNQLLKFEKIGIGKETEHGTRVSKKLIKTTKKRLRQLSPILKKINKKDRLNGYK
tara:strand:+ start:458 stop:706 length:249 start_codon:yes stop_codon:yes gene_type:complete